MGKTPREIAEAYWEAESKRDIEGVLAFYHTDAVMKPPGQVLRGHAEIRKFYEASAAQYPAVEVKIVHDITKGNEALLEWEAILIDHDGGRHPLNGANVILIEDGKYRYLHTYFDPTILPGK
ncbi:MAG: nuclear transport factor 2 family protein [Anaerolineae bacterium]|jgi:uncharacterized protein (TIGR02246 family)|nr:nuclear transport factor 2 family protein [Anaerolineae bacterium]